jgi:hypothetical protein
MGRERSFYKEIFGQQEGFEFIRLKEYIEDMYINVLEL